MKLDTWADRQAASDAYHRKMYEGMTGMPSPSWEQPTYDPLDAIRLAHRAHQAAMRPTLTERLVECALIGGMVLVALVILWLGMKVIP